MSIKCAANIFWKSKVNVISWIYIVGRFIFFYCFSDDKFGFVFYICNIKQFCDQYLLLAWFWQFFDALPVLPGFYCWIVQWYITISTGNFEVEFWFRLIVVFPVWISVTQYILKISKSLQVYNTKPKLKKLKYRNNNVNLKDKYNII